jgi:hypothetical protein
MAAEVRDLAVTGDVPGPDGLRLQAIVDDITERVARNLALRAAERTLEAPGPDDGLVFVVSSFSREMEPIFEAIAAAARAAGLHAERVKDVRGDYRVTERILLMIRQARFVVADLTHERPNVYFELGYARALGKTVITILRAGTAVHFDVQDWSYLEYYDSRPLETDLLDRLEFELRLARVKPRDS